MRPTRVTITGTGFRVGAKVTVDVPALNVIVLDSTTITAIVPARAVGPADVVVTNYASSGGTLTGAFTYSFDEPFTLVPSTDVIDADGDMSVSWTAPAGRAGDWIAVVRVGGTYDDDWYGVTNGARSGTIRLTAPGRPGQYEFRYFVDEFRYLVDEMSRDVARSRAVTVR